VTELSFLISLLLNDELPKSLKQTVADRIKEVELKLVPSVQPRAPAGNQAASTQKILDEMAMNPIPVEQPLPQTQAAAQALAHRQQLIAQATSGVAEKGRTSPRKF
jgi:hypothetical protein